MTSKKFIEKYNQKITEEGRKLVGEFFITFSRFECALKATITYANGNQRKVEPNWDSFVASIRDSFDKTKNQELNDAVDFLLNSPPRIQSLNGGNITWRNRVFQDNEREINKLCLHIRDIRNNLFHGGKFNGVYQQDVSRNYKLINSAMIILNEWLELSADVQSYFLKDLV